MYQYTGVEVIEDFNNIDSLYKNGEVSISEVDPEIKLYPNQCVVLKCDKQSALGIVKGSNIRLVKPERSIAGIKPRNKEQSMLTELLLDKDIDLLTISGAAGSGKTLLSTAFAWQQFSKDKIDKIIFVKPMVSVGAEVGFLKGSLKDKMIPWLGPYFDAFEILGVPDYELMDYMDPETRAMRKDSRRIEIYPLTFIQGRSIKDAVIIIDECQNIDHKEVSQIVTRAANNCKIILLGDVNQVFNKKLSSSKNGLASTIEAGKKSDLVGHITLIKSERSRLAAWAIENL